MVAGSEKETDRNQRPSTATSTSTCTSTITVFVDVDVDVLVLVDVLSKADKGVKHTPENVRLLLPPRQSPHRGTHVTLRVSRRSPGGIGS